MCKRDSAGMSVVAPWSVLCLPPALKPEAHDVCSADVPRALNSDRRYESELSGDCF